MIDVVCLVLGVWFVLDRLVKGALIVRFFRRPEARAEPAPSSVSLMQPILSGDPGLEACLRHNLRTPLHAEVEFLWLVDEDDLEAHRICGNLMREFSDRSIRLLLTPPPGRSANPKMLKLIAGFPHAAGAVVGVLDDDTMLPGSGIEPALNRVADAEPGLAFGLPYYVSFGNFWSSLVAGFVNSYSLLTYIPVSFFREPFTINGMFYLARRETWDAVGGFAGLENFLADDFAVAQRFRAQGRRLVQSPLLHGIATHVTGPVHYARLMHRWLVFARESVLSSLPWRDLLAAWLLAFVPTVVPLVLLVLAGIAPSPVAWGALLATLATHFALFAFCNGRYLNRATSWSRSWIVPLVQLLLPMHLLIAVLFHRRIHWRGHVIDTRAGGQMVFARRRSDAGPSDATGQATPQRHWMQNAAIVLPITIVHSLIYRQLTYESFFPVRVLHSTWLDRQIPFLPWTVWPYLLMVLMTIGCPIVTKRRDVFRMTLTAYLLATLMAFGTYLLIPTAIERQPLPAMPETVSLWAYRQLLSTMGQNSCFPSGHIIFPMLGSWALVYERRTGWSVVLAMLTFCSSASILTLKEHVAWDWLGGMIVGVLSIALAIRICRPKLDEHTPAATPPVPHVP